MYIEQNWIVFVPTFVVKCGNTKYCQFIGRKVLIHRSISCGRQIERSKLAQKSLKLSRVDDNTRRRPIRRCGSHSYFQAV